MGMRRSFVAAALLVPAALGLVAREALAKREMPVPEFQRFQTAATFEIVGRPIGGSTPANATAAYLTSTRIAALDDGALVIDADSGELLRTDRDGNNVAAFTIGRNAGLLAYDPAAKLAYVADRAANRIAVVKVGAQLELARSIATPVEPYGVALSPDRRTVMVTTIADRALVAYDAASGNEKWRAALGHEPRGLAVSPDGTRALVAYLQTGTVDQFDLLESHAVEHIALSTINSPRRCRRCTVNGDPDAFARAAFVVTFMGDHEAVVPFQRETPVQIANGGNSGSYGGGFESPVQHQLAMLQLDGERTLQATAAIGVELPRAVVWDGAHDALYVAGMGKDSIQQVRAASQSSATAGIAGSLTSGDKACGPDGLAVTRDGAVLVWCAFTRNVERLDFVDAKGELATAMKTSAGPTLVASAMSQPQHDGYVMFHSANEQISQGGGLACASCHPDGRDDGLSWKIEKNTLQTPLLAGRIVGTHPYKWDGGDPDLETSLATTMKRLGGSGLDKAQTAELAAYLDALPAPRTPTRDVAQVARGKALFDSAEVGCRGCHDGPTYSDNLQHSFAGSTLPSADTPSLVGLAASAPYFHDGSAATLEALLRDRGAVHGMGETARLSDAQIADLTAFLETL
jgi:DNA-binding beta-propeller fold protein YncE/cytochrome c553